MTRCVVWRSLALVLIAALAAPALPGAALAQDAGPPGAAEPEPLVVSLQDVLTQALQNNLEITVSRYEPLKSEQFVVAAESAFDPSLTGRALSSDSQRESVFSSSVFFQHQKTHEYGASFLDPLTIGTAYQLQVSAVDEFSASNFFGPTSQTTGYTTNWHVLVTQPLLRNLGRQVNTSRIVIAKNTKAVTDSQFRQTVIDTLTNAEKTYWNLTFALMELETSKASLKLAQDFLEQNKIKVRVGTLAPIEITQAEAEVADRDQTVIVATYAVATAEDALRRIVNVPRDSPIWSRPIRPSDAPTEAEVPVDQAAAEAAAAANRPDLEQARLEIMSRENELAYRKNLRRWGLNLTGDYGHDGFDQSTYSNSIDDLRDRTKTSWNAQLNLAIPLGNRAAVSAYTEADYSLTQSRYRFQQTGQNALIEVRNAVRAVQTNLKRIRAAQVNVRLQKEKLSAEQKKFENGMSTSFQVLQFQTDLTTAVSRENGSIVDYNKSLVELERAKGTLLAARNMEMPVPTDPNRRNFITQPGTKAAPAAYLEAPEPAQTTEASGVAPGR
jgi:outer membrane protein TolC